MQPSGEYCINNNGYGTDCSETGRDRRVSAHLNGVFPAATASLTLDVLRRPRGVFHGGRIAILMSHGLMPKIRYEEPYATQTYTQVGIAWTVTGSVESHWPIGPAREPLEAR